jgi:hypothetical protein
LSKISEVTVKVFLLGGILTARAFDGDKELVISQITSTGTEAEISIKLEEKPETPPVAEA